MTSRQLIIPGEDPADLQELHRQWHELYPTDNPVAERAVGRAADSEWLLMRVERGADGMDAKLFEQPMAQWSAKNHADYALSQRYTTAKRRELERDRRAIAHHRREARQDARDAAAAAKPAPEPRVTAESKVEALEAQHLLRIKGRSSAKDSDATSQMRRDHAEIVSRALPEDPDPNKKSDAPLLQWVSVSVAEGKTKTTLNPTNEQLLVSVERSNDTTVVLRKVAIKADPLPPEYAWTAAAPESNRRENSVVIAMTALSFRVAVERETDGHVQYWADLESNDAPILEKLGVFSPAK